MRAPRQMRLRSDPDGSNQSRSAGLGNPHDYHDAAGFPQYSPSLSTTSAGQLESPALSQQSSGAISRLSTQSSSGEICSPATSYQSWGTASQQTSPVTTFVHLPPPAHSITRYAHAFPTWQPTDERLAPASTCLADAFKSRGRSASTSQVQAGANAASVSNGLSSAPAAATRKRKQPAQSRVATAADLAELAAFSELSRSQGMTSVELNAASTAAKKPAPNPKRRFFCTYEGCDKGFTRFARLLPALIATEVYFQLWSFGAAH